MRGRLGQSKRPVCFRGQSEKVTARAAAPKRRGRTELEECLQRRPEGETKRLPAVANGRHAHRPPQEHPRARVLPRVPCGETASPWASRPWGPTCPGLTPAGHPCRTPLLWQEIHGAAAPTPHPASVKGGQTVTTPPSPALSLPRTRRPPVPRSLLCTHPYKEEKTLPLGMGEERSPALPARPPSSHLFVSQRSRGSGVGEGGAAAWTDDLQHPGPHPDLRPRGLPLGEGAACPACPACRACRASSARAAAPVAAAPTAVNAPAAATAAATARSALCWRRRQAHALRDMGSAPRQRGRLVLHAPGAVCSFLLSTIQVSSPTAIFLSFPA